jgi:phage gpG-like protein
MIEIRVIGLENLEEATGEMAAWGRKPFDGKAALRIRELWRQRLEGAFESKGSSIGERWPPLSPEYAIWKGRHFPGRPLLVRTGRMKRSLTNQKSRDMIFNRSGGRQLILGTRVFYAKYHQYGYRKDSPRRVLPARPFIKVDQGVVNTFANEMRKDVELAMEGSKRWRDR